MSKDKISDYSATANSNTDIGGINIDEGCAPSGINDAIRTLMKQLKDFQQGTQSDVFKGPLQVGAASSIQVTDNSNAALRITQLGTGNALLVEDNTNPDSTPFVIDDSGNTIIGTTATQNTRVSTTVVAPKFQLNGTSVASSSIGQFSWNSNPYYIFSKSASATIGSYSAVGSGVFLGATIFAGDDGTQFTNASRIEGWTDAAVSNGVVPGRITFSTADSAGTMTERVRIASDGLVSLQNSSGLSIARTAVTSPATTDGNVFSGTYTPTLTNTTNVAVSSAGVAQYMRVGNVVTVSGQLDIDPTATGDTVMGVSLPIASNIASQINVAGTFISLSGATFQGGSIYGDSTNDRATFRLVASSTSNFAYQYTFTYRVI